MADASPLTNDELAQQLMDELAAQGANLNMAGATASHAEHEGASGDARSFSGSVNGQASECDSEGHQVDDAGEAAFFEALNALRRAKQKGIPDEVKEAEAHLQQVVRAELRGEDTHGA